LTLIDFELSKGAEFKRRINGCLNYSRKWIKKALHFSDQGKHGKGERVQGKPGGKW